MLPSIEKLQQLSPYEISLLIRNNHPQIIAQICYHMDDAIASSVLSQLTERLRHDVVLRISTLYDMDTVWLNKLDSILLHIIENKSADLIFQDGISKSASILQNMNTHNQTHSLDYIREYDPELGQRICDSIPQSEEVE